MECNKHENKTRREKIFLFRNSILTDIFENNRTPNFHHVYVILFTCVFLQNVLKQYVKEGSVNFGLKTITTGFAKFDKAILIWLCCFSSTCASFLFFQIWAKLRNFRKGLVTLWDWLWVVSLGFYYFYALKLTSDAIRYFRFNPPNAAFVALETVRLLMKVHSFVRSKTPSVLLDAEATPIVEFSRFFYFLFAPTLIYRENYPQTKHINWKFVTHRLLECLSVLFMFSFIIEAIYPPPERWLAGNTVSDIMLYIIEYIPYGGLVLCGTFLLVFHSMQNFFAEITRFGDRLFYLDWWNEYDFSAWLKKWNLLVRDWLYYYVYRDFKQHIYNNTFFAVFVVFLVSFIMHEFIMFCVIGKLFPCFLLVAVIVLFPSFFLNFPKNPLTNVLLWFSGCLLISALLVLYIFEHYALMMAPLKDPTLAELIIPRFITCDCVLKF